MIIYKNIFYILIIDRLDGLAKRKNEGKPQTMEDFLQVPDYYNMEDTSGKKRVCNNDTMIQIILIFNSK